MKRFFSVVFLFVFLFNVVGYNLFFMGLRYQVNRETNERLETGNYESDETILFKIPLTIPYPAGSGDFHRVEGSFENKGEFFKLVKQKFENDTLFVVCIKDFGESRISNEMNDYAKLANDLPASSQQTVKLLNGFLKDYIPNSAIIPQSSFWLDQKTQLYSGDIHSADGTCYSLFSSS